MGGHTPGSNRLHSSSGSDHIYDDDGRHVNSDTDSHVSHVSYSPLSVTLPFSPRHHPPPLAADRVTGASRADGVDYGNFTQTGPTCPSITTVTESAAPEGRGSSSLALMASQTHRLPVTSRRLQLLCYVLAELSSASTLLEDYTRGMLNIAHRLVAAWHAAMAATAAKLRCDHTLTSLAHERVRRLLRRQRRRQQPPLPLRSRRKRSRAPVRDPRSAADRSGADPSHPRPHEHAGTAQALLSPSSIDTTTAPGATTPAAAPSPRRRHRRRGSLLRSHFKQSASRASSTQPSQRAQSPASPLSTATCSRPTSSYQRRCRRHDHPQRPELPRTCPTSTKRARLPRILRRSFTDYKEKEDDVAHHVEALRRLLVNALFQQFLNVAVDTSVNDLMLLHWLHRGTRGAESTLEAEVLAAAESEALRHLKREWGTCERDGSDSIENPSDHVVGQHDQASVRSSGEGEHPCWSLPQDSTGLEAQERDARYDGHQTSGQRSGESVPNFASICDVLPWRSQPEETPLQSPLTLAATLTAAPLQRQLSRFRDPASRQAATSTLSVSLATLHHSSQVVPPATPDAGTPSNSTLIQSWWSDEVSQQIASASRAAAVGGLQTQSRQHSVAMTPSQLRRLRKLRREQRLRGTGDRFQDLADDDVEEGDLETEGGESTMLDEGYVRLGGMPSWCLDNSPAMLNPDATLGVEDDELRQAVPLQRYPSTSSSAIAASPMPCAGARSFTLTNNPGLTPAIARHGSSPRSSQSGAQHAAPAHNIPLGPIDGSDADEAHSSLSPPLPPPPPPPPPPLDHTTATASSTSSRGSSGRRDAACAIPLHHFMQLASSLSPTACALGLMSRCIIYARHVRSVDDESPYVAGRCYRAFQDRALGSAADLYSSWSPARGAAGFRDLDGMKSEEAEVEKEREREGVSADSGGAAASDFAAEREYEHEGWFYVVIASRAVGACQHAQPCFGNRKFIFVACVEDADEVGAQVSSSAPRLTMRPFPVSANTTLEWSRQQSSFCGLRQHDRPGDKGTNWPIRARPDVAEEAAWESVNETSYSGDEGGESCRPQHGTPAFIVMHSSYCTAAFRSSDPSGADLGVEARYIRDAPDDKSMEHSVTSSTWGPLHPFMLSAFEQTILMPPNSGHEVSSGSVLVRPAETAANRGVERSISAISDTAGDADGSEQAQGEVEGDRASAGELGASAPSDGDTAFAMELFARLHFWVARGQSVDAFLPGAEEAEEERERAALAPRTRITLPLKLLYADVGDITFEAQEEDETDSRLCDSDSDSDGGSGDPHTAAYLPIEATANYKGQQLLYGALLEASEVVVCAVRECRPHKGLHDSLHTGVPHGGGKGRHHCTDSPLQGPGARADVEAQGTLSDDDADPFIFDRFEHLGVQGSVHWLQGRDRGVAQDSVVCEPAAGAAYGIAKGGRSDEGESYNERSLYRSGKELSSYEEHMHRNERLKNEFRLARSSRLDALLVDGLHGKPIARVTLRQTATTFLPSMGTPSSRAHTISRRSRSEQQPSREASGVEEVVQSSRFVVTSFSFYISPLWNYLRQGKMLLVDMDRTIVDNAVTLSAEELRRLQWERTNSTSGSASVSSPGDGRAGDGVRRSERSSYKELIRFALLAANAAPEQSGVPNAHYEECRPVTYHVAQDVGGRMPDMSQPPCTEMIYVRPGMRELLYCISCEWGIPLVLVTKSTRLRAEAILSQVLDPQGILFPDRERQVVAMDQLDVTATRHDDTAADRFHNRNRIMNAKKCSRDVMRLYNSLPTFATRVAAREFVASRQAQRCYSFTRPRATTTSSASTGIRIAPPMCASGMGCVFVRSGYDGNGDRGRQARGVAVIDDCPQVWVEADWPCTVPVAPYTLSRTDPVHYLTPNGLIGSQVLSCFFSTKCLVCPSAPRHRPAEREEAVVWPHCVCSCPPSHWIHTHAWRQSVGPAADEQGPREAGAVHEPESGGPLKHRSADYRAALRNGGFTVEPLTLGESESSSTASSSYFSTSSSSSSSATSASLGGNLAEDADPLAVPPPHRPRRHGRHSQAPSTPRSFLIDRGAGTSVQLPASTEATLASSYKDFTCASAVITGGEAEEGGEGVRESTVWWGDGAEEVVPLSESQREGAVTAGAVAQQRRGTWDVEDVEDVMPL